MPPAPDGEDDWESLARKVERAVADARREMGADVAVLRLVLDGLTPLAWRVARDLDLLSEQAVKAADLLGTVWIDKLENQTLSGSAEVGLPAELTDLILQGLPQDPGILAAADQEIDELMKALPKDKDLRGMFGDDAAAQALARDALMQAGIAEVLGRLAPEGSF